MHKLIASSTILEHEISELRLLVERQTGLVLDCPNSALTARVADFMETHEIASSNALLEALRSPDQESSMLPGLLDGVININTGFFRHSTALNALTRQVLPQLWTRKSADGPSPIRIWSTGCGSGEDTYSIAMAVCDAANPANVNTPAGGNVSTGTGKAPRTGGIADNSVGVTAPPAKLSGVCSVHIVGSDLMPSNIEIADRGVYPQSSLDGLPPATIRNYFSKIGTPAAALPPQEDPEMERKSTSSYGSQASNGAHLLVKPRLRSLVTFNCMNLARPGYIGRFDCIFCMDVLPHFSRAQRIAVLERLHLYLEPGGYLFLGQTEKLVASNLNFRSETFDGYTYHRKPVAASAAYGR
jgi:chemotaxis methyl-accepting protein methylase